MKTYLGNIINLDSTSLDAAVAGVDNAFTGQVTVPTPPVANQDFATKGYVDGLAGGLGASGGSKVLIDGSAVMTGLLTLSGSATLGTHVVKKTYVDTSINTALTSNTTVLAAVDTSISNSAYAVKTGEILKKPTATTPTGFLKCNGAIVLKSTYGSLYTVIGDQYNAQPMTSGGGRPWHLQYSFNNTQISNTLTFTNTNNDITDVTSTSNVIVTKNRVYLLCDSITAYTAAINSNGTLGAWTKIVNFIPAGAQVTQIIMTSTKVYLLGGTFGGDGIDYMVNLPINADGTLGTWATEPRLPTIIYQAQSIVTKNRVYIMGGRGANNAWTNLTYTAVINPDGTIGSWSAGPNLPTDIINGEAIITSNKVYVIGGQNSITGPSNKIYVSTVNLDGTLGTWSLYPITLPETMLGYKLVVTRNKLYTLGGTMSSGTTNKCYVSTIDGNGDLSAFTLTSPLYNILAMNTTAVFITSGYIYIGPGNDITLSAYTKTIYSAPFSGGLNDYVALPDAGVLSTQFTLPNLVMQDAATTGIYSYIKT